MSPFIVLGTAAAALVVGLFLKRRASSASGYQGAIGFKNRNSSEIATLSLAGFRRPVECRTLARGEHSFNYPGSQSIPVEVAITWRFVGDTADRTARVSLAGVPPDAKDGELFFALSETGDWAAEYAPTLQLEKLQRGE
jgi:hypothetical protein